MLPYFIWSHPILSNVAFNIISCERWVSPGLFDASGSSQWSIDAPSIVLYIALEVKNDWMHFGYGFANKRARCLNTGRVAFSVATTGGAPITCVIHGPKTRHVFGMYEKMSVEITTSENSWNRACYISAYCSFLIAVGLLTQSKTSELAN